MHSWAGSRVLCMQPGATLQGTRNPAPGRAHPADSANGLVPQAGKQRQLAKPNTGKNETFGHTSVIKLYPRSSERSAGSTAMEAGTARSPHSRISSIWRMGGGRGGGDAGMGAVLAWGHGRGQGTARRQHEPWGRACRRRSSRESMPAGIAAPPAAGAPSSAPPLAATAQRRQRRARRPQWHAFPPAAAARLQAGEGGQRRQRRLAGSQRIVLVQRQARQPRQAGQHRRHARQAAVRQVQPLQAGGRERRQAGRRGGGCERSIHCARISRQATAATSCVAQ